MCPINNVLGSTSDGVGAKVVKKLVDGFGSGFSGSGLLGAQGAESGKKLVVDSLCVVEMGADDALDSFDAIVGERRTVGFIVGDLGDLAVDDLRCLCGESWRLVGIGWLYLTWMLLM